MVEVLAGLTELDMHTLVSASLPVFVIAWGVRLVLGVILNR
jgi:hypothetical protein